MLFFILSFLRNIKEAQQQESVSIACLMNIGRIQGHRPLTYVDQFEIDFVPIEIPVN